jgi:ribonuclease III
MPRAQAKPALTPVEAAIGHAFSAPALLAQALTHDSFINKVSERTQGGYERLEFLGDRVLGLVIAELLFAEHPDLKEGLLARRFAELVRRAACEEVAEAWGLAASIRVAPQDKGGQSPLTPSVKADVCEAVIGAVFLDAGYDAARGVVERDWRPLLAAPPAATPDAKSALQEWTQGKAIAMPVYEVTARGGSDHLPHFTVSVSIAGHEPEYGRGPSKRDAQQEAARQFLKRQAIWKEQV